MKDFLAATGYAPPAGRPLPLRALGTVAGFAARKPLGTVGAAFIFVMLLCALFADRQLVTLFRSNEPLLAPMHYDDQKLSERLRGPSYDHPFGTDRLGRDQLSQIIYGARVSVIVGLGSVLLAITLATTIGVLSGYIGGRFDLIVQRFVDAWLAFPAIVILISGVQLAKAYAGSSGQAQMFAVILVLGIVLASGASRVIRSSAIAVKGNAYVDAARTIGAGEVRIILRYILPNVMAVVIVLATVQLGAAILAESTISFLGFGVPPPFPSWGRMLSADGLLLMRKDPWLAFWPGAAIFLVVFGFNMFGDALRDVLDPRLRGTR